MIFNDFARKPDFLQRNHLKYPLSYRNLKEMMIERGIQVDHSTIMRRVYQYSPEKEKKLRRHLRLTNYSGKLMKPISK